ncbi:MAG: cbb3-type cytochrome oxidase assembly protein CcoS [Ahniella sp.]|nr:cbb3-type cytochrome oxidase assembly protein CcoS [Ahniella sp.]
MISLLGLIPIAVLLVLIAGAIFVWAVKSGQYDDLDAPALDILRDDPKPMPKPTEAPPIEPERRDE